MIRKSIFVFFLIFSLIAGAEAPTGFRVVPSGDVAVFITGRLERIKDLEEAYDLRLPQATTVMFVRESRENKKSADWVQEFITDISVKYGLDMDEDFNKTLEAQASDHFLDKQEAFMTALLTLKNEEIGKEINTLFQRIVDLKTKK